MFSIHEFQRLKSHVPAGYVAFGFSLNPRVRISISDGTSTGGGWEMRIHEEPTQRMCILTERNGQLTADYRYLVPLPSGGYDFQAISDPDFERRAQSLFADAHDFLERKRADELEAARRATEKLHALASDEGAKQRWRDLVRLLAPEPALGDKIAKATAAAFSAPESFLRRFRLPRVTGDEPWLALIAALRKNKLVIEVDWTEDPSEIPAGIDGLCARSSRPSLDWAKLSIANDSSAAALLDAANDALEPDSVSLVFLNAGTDSFPTALLPLTSFEKASSLAASFGWEIKRRFG